MRAETTIDGMRIDNPFDNPDGRRYAPRHVEALVNMHVAQMSGVQVGTQLDYVDTLSGRYQVPFGD